MVVEDFRMLWLTLCSYIYFHHERILICDSIKKFQEARLICSGCMSLKVTVETITYTA